MEIDTSVSNESGVAAAVHAGKEIIIASKRGLLNQQGSLYTLRDDGSIHIERELSDEIDKRNARPVHLRGAARVLDEASLIAHALRNKDTSSAIFYDAARVLVVYDYNRAVTTEDRDGCARWGKHTAEYKPSNSEEWKAWIGGSGKMLQQAEFADLLEERVKDIAGPREGRDVPTAAQLMTVALQLKVTSEDVIESEINRTTGEYHLVAKVEQKTTGQTRLPKEFDIEIPIHDNGPLYRITCSFRFRKDGAKPTFGWIVRGVERMQREAMAQMVERVKDATKLPAFAGSPES